MGPGGHRRVSTPVKASHHPSSWCRFVGSGLLVHHFEVWRRDRKDPVFAYGRCIRYVEQAIQAFTLRCSENSSDVIHGNHLPWVVCHPTICTAFVAAFTAQNVRSIVDRNSFTFSFSVANLPENSEIQMRSMSNFSAPPAKSTLIAAVTCSERTLKNSCFCPTTFVSLTTITER